MELERRSSGVAKGGLATGIVGTSLGALNSMAILGAGAAGIGNGFFGRNNGVQPVIVMENGGWGGCGNGYGGYGRNGDGCCSEDHYVNRYELELQQKIAEKDSQIALRDANTSGMSCASASLAPFAAKKRSIPWDKVKEFLTLISRFV